MVKEEIRRNVYIGHLKRKTFYDIAYPQSNQIIINYLSYINQNETEFSPRTSHPEVFLEKGVLKICSKYTGEYPCRSVISIKLQSNFIEITLPVWVFSCKFAVCFQNTFSQEHLWVAASVDTSIYQLKTLVCLKIELFSMKENFIQNHVFCVEAKCFLF